MYRKISSVIHVSVKRQVPVLVRPTPATLLSGFQGSFRISCGDVGKPCRVAAVVTASHCGYCALQMLLKVVGQDPDRRRTDVAVARPLPQQHRCQLPAVEPVHAPRFLRTAVQVCPDRSSARYWSRHGTDRVKASAAGEQRREGVAESVPKAIRYRRLPPRAPSETMVSHRLPRRRAGIAENE